MPLPSCNSIFTNLKNCAWASQPAENQGWSENDSRRLRIHTLMTNATTTPKNLGITQTLDADNNRGICKDP